MAKKRGTAGPASGSSCCCCSRNGQTLTPWSRRRPNRRTRRTWKRAPKRSIPKYLFTSKKLGMTRVAHFLQLVIYILVVTCCHIAKEGK